MATTVMTVRVADRLVLELVDHADSEDEYLERLRASVTEAVRSCPAPRDLGVHFKGDGSDG